MCLLGQMDFSACALLANTCVPNRILFGAHLYENIENTLPFYTASASNPNGDAPLVADSFDMDASFFHCRSPKLFVKSIQQNILLFLPAYQASLVLSLQNRGMSYNRCEAGVREYWIVDTSNRVVDVFRWEDSPAPQTYDKKDKARVGILIKRKQGM